MPSGVRRGSASIRPLNAKTRLIDHPLGQGQSVPLIMPQRITFLRCAQRRCVLSCCLTHRANGCASREQAKRAASGLCRQTKRCNATLNVLIFGPSKMRRTGGGGGFHVGESREMGAPRTCPDKALTNRPVSATRCSPCGRSSRAMRANFVPDVAESSSEIG